MVGFLYSFYLLINIVRLNFTLSQFENCFRGCFFRFYEDDSGLLEPAKILPIGRPSLMGRTNERNRMEQDTLPLVFWGEKRGVNLFYTLTGCSLKYFHKGAAMSDCLMRSVRNSSYTSSFVSR